MTDQPLRDRVLFGLAVAIALLGVARLRPPTPEPGFEAELAHTLDLLGPDPHPVGSAAHERALDGLLDELDELGVAPILQHAVSCGPRGRCAGVTNVTARFGPAGGRPIAVVAHYDSVGAGPRARADGAGV